MWLTSSSIGRKFIMALTGACLVLFVTFHVVMNAVCIVWPTSYNQICMLLGANWYALIASVGLAALFIIHIIYAIWLTLQNRKARGADRYAVTSRPPQVEWASKNMLVLGIVILAFLVVHLIQFWAKMQLQELLHSSATICDGAEGEVAAPAEFGTLFIQAAFSCWWTPVIYIIGFVALWFHMTHGFWSMFHSVGWDNNIWLPRLKCIGYWWVSIVVALFIAQAIVFTVKASNNDYFTDEALQEQYAEYYGEKAEAALNAFDSARIAAQALPQDQAMAAYAQAEEKAINELEAITTASAKLCPDASNRNLAIANNAISQLKQEYAQIQAIMGMQSGTPVADDAEEVVIEEEETTVQ